MSEQGLCACGCGRATNLARFSDGSKGHVQGKPMRFLRGHGIRQASARRVQAIPDVRDRTIELYQAGLTGKQVAEQVGVSEWSVWKVLREAGVASRRRGLPPQSAGHREAGIARRRDVWRAVVDLYDEGFSAREISERLPKTLPTSTSNVYRLLREFGVTRRPRGASSTPAERATRRRRHADRERKRVAVEIRRSIANPVHLDAPANNEPKASALGELIADAHHYSDPQRELESKLFDEIVGDLTIEEVGTLDEQRLRQLQTRLLEAGFAPGGVQRKERERLRDPARHRGNAPATPWQGFASRHRGRKEQKALMEGKRTSRKQPKGWKRAA